MENEIDLENLEKVPGSTDADRQRWAKALKEGQEAMATGREFNEALPRMFELRAQTESTIADLEKSLPTTILNWATGKQPRKAVEDLKRSIAKYRDLLADCDRVPSLIKERRPAIEGKVEKANIARSQIQEKRDKEAKSG
jgi:hypothetical protein